MNDLVETLKNIEDASLRIEDGKPILNAEKIDGRDLDLLLEEFERDYFSVYAASENELRIEFNEED